jgi:hypothetical protein
LLLAKVVNAKKLTKHFALDIRNGHFTGAHKVDQIVPEAKVDGIYVSRTSVPAEDLGRAIQACKDLFRVERAFRSMRTVDLEIRPIFAIGVPIACARASYCACSAYRVEWHLRQVLAPYLFHDTDLEAARAERSSPVAAKEPSPAAKYKKRSSSAMPI